VPLGRPRDASSPAFNELKRELSGMVMEEQLRSEEDQRTMPAARV
jgi:hypothetical protein